MRSQIQKPKGKDGFPNSPIAATDLLIPITSWSGMVCESRITHVVFDQFWYESVLEGVCYFFRWLGKQRATVLLIFDKDELTHMECRTLGDKLIPQAEAEPIIFEVVKRFRMAGFWRIPPVIDESVYSVSEEKIECEMDIPLICIEQPLLELVEAGEGFADYVHSKDASMDEQLPPRLRHSCTIASRASRASRGSMKTK